MPGWDLHLDMENSTQGVRGLHIQDRKLVSDKILTIEMILNYHRGDWVGHF